MIGDEPAAFGVVREHSHPAERLWLKVVRSGVRKAETIRVTTMGDRRSHRRI
jgi:hypothetical protein